MAATATAAASTSTSGRGRRDHGQDAQNHGNGAEAAYDLLVALGRNLGLEFCSQLPIGLRAKLQSDQDLRVSLSAEVRGITAEWCPQCRAISRLVNEVSFGAELIRLHRECEGPYWRRGPDLEPASLRPENAVEAEGQVPNPGRQPKLADAGVDPDELGIPEFLRR